MKKLDFNQMEVTNGGLRLECDGLSEALSGSALVIGFASWWTGAGAGLALTVSAAAYGAYLAGC